MSSGPERRHVIEAFTPDGWRILVTCPADVLSIKRANSQRADR
jgi:hypothetical protein